MKGKRLTIAILLGDTQSTYARDQIKGFNKGAVLADVNLVFMAGQQLSNKFEKFIGDELEGIYREQFNSVHDYVRYLKPDALIITYGCLAIFKQIQNMDAFLDQFEGIPCVILEDLVDREGVPCYAYDNDAGMRQCVRHLIQDHGYQKIAYISGPEGNRDSDERKKAFLEVMRENHLEVPVTMMAKGDFSEHVEEQVEYLLAHNQQIDAIVCANDSMAKCCYQVLGEHEIAVGAGGIAVTGYDDTEDARLLTPALTSVSFNARKICTDAVLTAKAICQGEKVPSKIIPSYFVGRQSCGCRESSESDTLDGWDMVKAYIEYQKELDEEKMRTWMIPILIRGINLPDSIKDYKQVVMTIMKRMKSMEVRSFYLYLFEQPIVCDADNTQLKKAEQKLNLVGRFNEKEMIYVEPEDRKPISDDQGMVSLMQSEQRRFFNGYTLFHDNIQLGIMLMDSDIKDNVFWQKCSLQIGTLFYLANLNLEVANSKKELEKTLEIIREKNKLLNFISETDELTGLLNRRGFMEQAMELIECNPGKSGRMIFADLDHLKQINDGFGHAEGDFAIKTIADLLRDVFSKEAVLARIGGDEFVAVVLSEENDFGRAIQQKMTESMALFNAHCEKTYYVEASIGIVAFDCDEANINDLIRQSDEALYEAKSHRRESVAK